MTNVLHHLAFLALLSVFMAVPSCATGSYAAFGHCVSEKSQASASSVLLDVEAVFMMPLYVDAIAQLGIKYGPAAVECAIDIFIQHEGEKKMLTPNGSIALDRARAYRAAHP